MAVPLGHLEHTCVHAHTHSERPEGWGGDVGWGVGSPASRPSTPLLPIWAHLFPPYKQHMTPRWHPPLITVLKPDRPLLLPPVLRPHPSLPRLLHPHSLACKYFMTWIVLLKYMCNKLCLCVFSSSSSFLNSHWDSCCRGKYFNPHLMPPHQKNKNTQKNISFDIN